MNIEEFDRQLDEAIDLALEQIGQVFETFSKRIEALADQLEESTPKHLVESSMHTGVTKFQTGLVNLAQEQADEG